MLTQIQKVFGLPNKVYKFAVRKAKQAKQASLWNYHYVGLREPKVKSWVPHDDPRTQEGLIKELEKNNFNVIRFEINVSDYKQYISKAGYHKFPGYYDGGKAVKFVEKSLEHYLAAKLLNLSKDDVYIDIANADAPPPKIYSKLHGCMAYRQDLIFPEGIHGNIIGGNAADMPIEDSFATKMALHCSFEHFERDSDMRFIKEASRVLKKKGRLCILPLYLFTQYAIQTDPSVLPKGGLPFEKDAVLYCAKGYGNRHGRFYDVPHLIERIRNNLNDLALTIYVVQNEKEIDQSCHVKFVAFFEKQGRNLA